MEQSRDDLDYLLPPNCPNTYYDTWDRHNSIAFSTAAKGLHNAPGENNCFVNSAVQVFWHLDVFRRSYRQLSGHTCMGNSCIFCALKVIFTQFQYSDQSALHPDALRKALADTFANQQRFQLGHMDDAAECFENILKRIHFHVANTNHEDTCTAPHCLPHRKFSLGIVEKVVCPCGASSKPLQYCEMVHYISASALVSQAQMMQKTGDVLHPDHFGLLLRNANALGDMRRCPGACGKTVQIRRTLLNAPDVVSIGLGWDSDHPSMEMTTRVAQNIGTTILLQDVFHSVMQDIKTKLQLVGLVCYYGKHYSTFVFHSKLRVWIYFDDTTVKEIGPSFEHVVDKCSKGRYQPLLLLYANPNATPVPVETAPKKRVMAPGYGLPGAPEEESSLDRTHESISSQHSYQRALTPNPEPTSVVEQPSHPRARSVTPSSYESSRRSIMSPSPTMSEHSRQESFMLAMSGNKAEKTRHPLKLGGQAGFSHGGTPGPMTPVSEQSGPRESAFRPPNQGDNYSDYTLSTSDQYRRPSLTGFQPEDLPLMPNLKGDSPRKESFKKGKEPLKADVIRYPGSIHNIYHHSDSSQISQSSTSSRVSTASYHGNSHPHMRHRTLSQGADEAYASDSSNYEGPSQHTIVKPTAESQMYEYEDGRGSYSHTPVQSGLATLPRKKKNTSHDSSNHSQQDSAISTDTLTRQGSVGNLLISQEQRPMSNVGKGDMSRHTPTREYLALPPAGPGKIASQSDQFDGNGKKQSETDKKSKKSKKEMKKGDKKKTKSLSDTGTMEDYKQSLTLVKAMNQNDMGSPEDELDQNQYINRNMVAHVLRNQGLQRQPSTHSTTSQASSSSIESEGIMGRLLASKRSEGGSHTDVSFDNVSLGSHKDSGYGSSDRNSSSSTGSGTVDPHVQYFISKSMVVPRNLNPQFLDRSQMVSDFTAPNPHVYPGLLMGHGDSKTRDNVVRDDKNRMNEPISQRKIMHPIKESSQEDILKVMGKDADVIPPPFKDSAKTSVSETLNKEGRPPPIPPKNFAAFQVSKSSHHREPSIDSLDKDEVENNYFVSMCEKADDLMDRCILAETEDDLSSALCFCDSALGCLKEAMNQTDISNKALVYAQKKHNSCLLKSRSLFKRSSHHASSDTSSHTSKRSSITSTDSDNSDKGMRRLPSKERVMGSQRPTSNNTHVAPSITQQFSDSSHSLNDTFTPRQSPLPGPQVMDGISNKGDSHLAALRNTSSSPHVVGSKGDDMAPKTHLSRAQLMDRAETASNHSRSGSNSSVRSSVSVPCSLSQAPPQGLPKSQSSVISQSGKSPPSSSVPLDQYGTLPRNRKPRRTSDPTGNFEVYQMYLNKQKTMAGDCSVDKSSTDSRESDSSSSEGNPQRRESKSELRGLRASNVVQVQKQNIASQLNNLDLVKNHNVRHGYDGGQHGPVRNHSNLDRKDCPANTTASRPIAVVSASQPSHRQSPAPNSQGHQTKMPLITLPQSRQHTASPSDLHQTAHRQNQGPSSNSKPFSTQQQSNYIPHPAYPQYVPACSQQQLKQNVDSSSPSSSTSSPALSQPPPHLVSGYSQPLPGQRVYPGNGHQRQSQTKVIPSPKPAYIHQPEGITYFSQGNRTLPANSSQNPAMMQTASSSQQTLTNPSVPYSNPMSQNLTPSNVPTSSGIRRSGAVQPPPPPMRTTSNPDFKAQLSDISSSAHHPSFKHQTVSSVACVQPNSHLPQSSGHHNTQMPSNSFPYGSQLRHASSSSGLNTISTMAPRPLERYPSQSDCRDPTGNQTDLSTYVSSSSHAPSHTLYKTAGNNQQSREPYLNSAQNSVHKSSSQTSFCVVDQNSSQNNGHSEPQQSVKALLSKFDQPSDKPAIKPKPSSLRPKAKTEKKPKSVLKSKKAKSLKSRKSVTFADDFSTRASGYESAAELSTFSSNKDYNDRAYFSDDEEHLGSTVSTSFYHDNDADDIEDSSNSDDYPLPHEDLACQLCRKREIEPGKGFCSKCSFYMSRLSS